MTENELVAIITADEEPLQAGCKRAEQALAKLADKTEGLGNRTETALTNKTGKVIGRMSQQIQNMGYQFAAISPEMAAATGGVGAMGDALGKAAGATRLFTVGASMMSGLMSGPMGWALLAGSAAYATFEMLRAKQAIDFTGDAIKKMNEQAMGALSGDLLGRLGSVGSGGEVQIWKEAATAASQHKKAQEELANADNKVAVTKRTLASEQERYNKLLAEQQRLDEAVRAAQRAVTSAGRVPGPDREAALKEARARAAENSGRLGQSGADLMDARRAANESERGYGTAKEEERRSAAESAKLAEQEAARVRAENMAKELSDLQKLGEQYGMTEAAKKRAGFIESNQLAPKPAYNGDEQAEEKRKAAVLAEYDAAAAVVASKQAAEKGSAFIKAIQDETAALNLNAEEQIRRRLGLEGMTAAVIEQAAAEVRLREASKKAQEGNKFVDNLQKEIDALGKSTEEIRKNDLARLGLGDAQRKLGETKIDEWARKQKALAGISEVDALAKNVHGQVETPEEKFAREKADLMRARALGIASGGAMGMDEETFNRGRMAAAQRLVQSQGQQPQFRAGFEDIRSLSKRIQSSHASGDDPALKVQERAAKAAEVTAKETTDMAKAIQEMKDTLKAGGKVVAVLGG